MGGAMRSTVFTWAGAVGCALLALSGLSAPASGGPTVGQGWCTASVPVLVVGGTPAGVAAAVSAARLGSRVMLIEARPYLGGDLTGAIDAYQHALQIAPTLDEARRNLDRARGKNLAATQHSSG